MNEVECAWVAGLLEGEGSFGLGGGTGTYKNGNPKRQAIRATCAMTDLDTIEKLAKTTGIGSVSREKRHDPRRPHAKPLYVWQASARMDVVPLLKAIRPHMSARRGERIDELLKFADDNPPRYNIRAEHGTVTRFRSGCRCNECELVREEYNRDQSRRYYERKAKRNVVPKDQD